MALTVNMPQLGESVTEGTIAKWLKQPGEMVSKYESIAEVVTDKVNAEIPAPADGSMGEHLASEGAVIAVGLPICTIETVEAAIANSAWAQPPEADAAAAAAAPAQAAATPAAAPAASAPAAAAPAAPVAQQPASPPVAPAEAAQDGKGNGHVADGEDYHLTPAVRMLVREHGVNLAEITGSGIGGRITKKDVLEHVQHRDAGTNRGFGSTPQTAAPSRGQAQPAQAPPAQAQAPQASSAPAAPVQMGEGDRLVAMTSIRRTIADHMVRSKATSPHAWMTMECDVTNIVRLRTARKDEFKRRHGVGLTYLPFVARAVIEGLQKYPSLNATWTDDGILEKHDINLGIAVALEDNLIVPVVRNADRLTVAGLATTMSELAGRARANKLKLDEIQGGTFTLNNTGALGTSLTQAIINQPQAAILAMDAVIKRVVVLPGDVIGIRSMMNLSMSFDHRLNDGLTATRFLKFVKDTLEAIDVDAALL